MAKEIFDFVTNSSSELGFLAEQVDNSKMKPAWIIDWAGHMRCI